MREICELCKREMFFWAEKNNFKSYQCSNTKCEFISILPMPTNHELNLAYKNYFKQRQLNHLLKKKRDKMFIIERDFLTSHINQGRFLDYGCSDGSFLNKFNSNIEKYGYEISKDAIKEGKKLNKLIDYIDLKFIEKSCNFFDCVILRGVIEHFSNLKKEIKPLINSIKKNKYLFITSTPNTNSIGAQLYKENWIMFEPPYHILYFNDKNIENFFKRFGFRLIKKKFFYEETPYAKTRDLKKIIDDIKNQSFKKSPAFYGTMMTLLFKKN